MVQVTLDLAYNARAGTMGVGLARADERDEYPVMTDLTVSVVKANRPHLFQAAALLAHDREAPHHG